MSGPKKGKTSAVWNFFEVIDRSNAKCVMCNRLFSYKSTTSNLRKHVERKHSTLQVIHSAPLPTKDEAGEYVQAQQIYQIASTPKKVGQQGSSPHIQIKLVPTQQTITQAQQFSTQQLNLAPVSVGEVKRTIKRERKPKESMQIESNNVNDVLMQLFIRDFHSISMVEDEGFKAFVKMLNPTYEIPSKKYISQTLLPAMYEKCLENSKIIAKCITTACLTTECWTSIYDESFLAVTVHFIDSDFSLKSLLISCSLLEDNFTSESLANELNRNVNEWDLQNKIIFSVSSGEDYMSHAIQLILKWDHFSCFAHSINKVIGDALNIGPVEELISKVRLVISFFKNDAMASSELHLSQINCNMEPKKLKQDIPTMWNSTFYMIDRFVELSLPISCTVTMQESNLPLIQPDEWTVLRELTKILKSLEAVTRAADEENYMFASLPIVLANGLFEICRKLENCDELSDTTKQVVMKLKTGFYLRFSELINNNILSVCTFLDPRFKTIPFRGKEELVKKRVIEMVTKNLSESEKGESEQQESKASKQQNIEELSVWEMFDKTAANSKLTVSTHSRIQLEVDRYIEDDLINRSSDPLEWWKIHRYNYPHLGEVVAAVFCSLATSIPCTRLFTKAGNIVTDRRSRLSANKVMQIVLLNANEKLFSR